MMGTSPDFQRHRQISFRDQTEAAGWLSQAGKEGVPVHMEGLCPGFTIYGRKRVKNGRATGKAGSALGQVKKTRDEGSTYRSFIEHWQEQAGTVRT